MAIHDGLARSAGAAALGVCVTLLTLGAAIADAPTATADIIVPDPADTKRVPVTYELDWGVLADRTSRAYVVEKGDTLSGIAAKQLGTVSRWKAIAEANPETVRGEEIRAGDTLWLPPIRSFDPPPAADAPADPAALGTWYDAFQLEHFARWRAAAKRRIGPSDPSSWFFVAAHSDSGGLRAALRKGDVPTDDPAFPKGWRADLGVSNIVHKDEATVRVVVRHRITGLKDGAVVTERKILRFDAKGEPVTKVLPVKSGGFEQPALPDDAPAPVESRDIPAPFDGGRRWTPAKGVLVALVGAGLVALVVVLRRRRTTGP